MNITNRLTLLSLFCAIFAFTACEKNDFSDFTQPGQTELNAAEAQLPTPDRYIVILNENNFTFFIRFFLKIK